MYSELNKLPGFENALFQVGDGWFIPIKKMCERISREVVAGADFKLLQIKTKFGELRVYYISKNENIKTAIEIAEIEVANKCEKCGELGEWDNYYGLVAVFCQKHAEE